MSWIASFFKRKQSVAPTPNAVEVSPQSRHPPDARQTQMDLKNEEIALRAVGEAMNALGYLKPQALPSMLEMLRELGFQGAKPVATAYRKSGEQLSREEKRSIGIRSNGFMSKAALGELTEKGLSAPLLAHEVTLLRAHFTRFRLNAHRSIVQNGIAEARYDCPFNESAACKRLHSAIVQTEDVLLDVPSDCTREACALSVTPHIDHTKDLI